MLGMGVILRAGPTVTVVVNTSVRSGDVGPSLSSSLCRTVPIMSCESERGAGEVETLTNRFGGALTTHFGMPLYGSEVPTRNVSTHVHRIEAVIILNPKLH